MLARAFRAATGGGGGLWRGRLWVVQRLQRASRAGECHRGPARWLHQPHVRTCSSNSSFSSSFSSSCSKSGIGGGEGGESHETKAAAASAEGIQDDDKNGSADGGEVDKAEEERAQSEEGRGQDEAGAVAAPATSADDDCGDDDGVDDVVEDASEAEEEQQQRDGPQDEAWKPTGVWGLVSDAIQREQAAQAWVSPVQQFLRHGNAEHGHICVREWPVDMRTPEDMLRDAELTLEDVQAGACAAYERVAEIFSLIHDTQEDFDDHGDMVAPRLAKLLNSGYHANDGYATMLDVSDISAEVTTMAVRPVDSSLGRHVIIFMQSLLYPDESLPPPSGALWSVLENCLDQFDGIVDPMVFAYHKHYHSGFADPRRTTSGTADDGDEVERVWQPGLCLDIEVLIQARGSYSVLYPTHDADGIAVFQELGSWPVRDQLWTFSCSLAEPEEVVDDVAEVEVPLIWNSLRLPENAEFVLSNINNALPRAWERASLVAFKRPLPGAAEGEDDDNDDDDYNDNDE